MKYRIFNYRSKQYQYFDDIPDVIRGACMGAEYAIELNGITLYDNDIVRYNDKYYLVFAKPEVEFFELHIRINRSPLRQAGLIYFCLGNAPLKSINEKVEPIGSLKLINEIIL